MSSIKKIRTTEGDLSIDYNSLDNLPTIPSKVSDLTNDSGFITKSVSSLDNYYTKTEVDEKEVEVTLNGASVSSPSFYAPTTAGTSGQVLKSSGNGVPVWGSVDVDAKEDKSNKVTSMTSSSTDLQYPSAKCVYDNLNEINDKLIYEAWNQSVSFELPIGRQALVFCSALGVLLIWNPADNINWKAVSGESGDFNVSRASNNTTITVSRRSGYATWSVFILK